MPVDPSTLLLFALASLALNLTPGPDMLYALGRSVSQGPRAGLAAAAGNFAGTLVHALALVLGLSALLTASAEAMTAVRVIGAVVLVVIGLRMLLARHDVEDPRQGGGAERPPAGLRRIATESFVIHTLNPKTAVFFLAFVPQFIATGPNAASATVQSAALGLWFAVQAATVLALIALLSAWAGRGLRRNLQHHARLITGVKRGVGAMLVLFGARLALR